MKTKNIIQSSVNVIKLVNLKKGDIFKTVEANNYPSDGIKYNIVIDLYNTGEQAYIETVSYKKSFSSVEAETKIISGDEDMAIFPATIEEVANYFNSAIKSIEEVIKNKEKELFEMKKSLQKAKEFVNGELSKNLAEAEFIEQTQEEYNKEKALKEAKIKELEN